MFIYVQLYTHNTHIPQTSLGTSIFAARRGGAEVAGLWIGRSGVRFPAYPHRVWALWWQGGKRRLRTSWCPCRGRLGMLKTPSCPWRGCPAAGQNLETGHLSRHYIAEISLNVTLNHNQQHNNLFLLTTISTPPYTLFILKKDYTSMKQPRFRMTQPRVIFIPCL